KMPAERAERELLRMVEAIRHDPSSQTGTWTDKALGVYVGWAARKDSFSDCMPLRNESGEKILAFSGEDFSDPGIKSGLKQRGHSFDPKGGAYLIHLAEEDKAFPASLNGRFHGLLTDTSRRESTLFNDRFGVQRIYYHESKEA